MTQTAAHFTLVMFLICLADVRPLHAQKPGIFVGAGGMLSGQGSEQPGGEPSLPSSGVGGSALGVTFEAGGWVSPSISVSFEASMPGSFAALQHVDYGSGYLVRSSHSDSIFSGLVHVHGAPAGRVRAAAVAGFSLVQEDTMQSTAFPVVDAVGFAIPGQFQPFGPEHPITRLTYGITAGVDVPVHVSRHISVVPQLRVHGIARASLSHVGDVESAKLGLGAWIIRPALGVRATF